MPTAPAVAGPAPVRAGWTGADRALLRRRPSRCRRDRGGCRRRDPGRVARRHWSQRTVNGSVGCSRRRASSSTGSPGEISTPRYRRAAPSTSCRPSPAGRYSAGAQVAAGRLADVASAVGQFLMFLLCGAGCGHRTALLPVAAAGPRHHRAGASPANPHLGAGGAGRPGAVHVRRHPAAPAHRRHGAVLGRLPLARGDVLPVRAVAGAGDPGVHRAAGVAPEGAEQSAGRRTGRRRRHPAGAEPPTAPSLPDSGPASRPRARSPRLGSGARIRGRAQPAAVPRPGGRDHRRSRLGRHRRSRGRVGDGHAAAEADPDPARSAAA